MTGAQWGGMLVALIGLIFLIFVIVAMSSVGCFAWLFAR